MNKLIDQFFLFSVKNREKIILLFKLAYISLILFTIVASYLFYTDNPIGYKLNEIGKEFGEFAIGLYILTVIPGIFRRFGWQHKLVSLLMIYRRYIGLLMFFFVLYHYMMMRGVAIIQTFKIFPIQLFELFGMAAFMGLFFLAITSNDQSTKKLGIWWGRIHALTYGILWLIFFHVALQDISPWVILLGCTGLIQIVSFVNTRLKR